ncbi:MAG: hypothetical protein CL693_09570 [Cellvibrionaceae bacterium]|nr:hypothetical protein [Cellvibrionaceae bacterium]
MHFRQLGRLASIGAISLCPLTTALAASDASNLESDFETQLALQIVNDYRQLRSSCNDQKDQERKMCYYRLRIGLWDYKEAKKTLEYNGIRTNTSTQVAHSL